MEQSKAKQSDLECFRPHMDSLNKMLKMTSSGLQIQASP